MLSTARPYESGGAPSMTSSVLFVLDRLADRVQDEQILPRRRNLSEQINLIEDLELARGHAVARQQRAIGSETLPRKIAMVRGRGLALRGYHRARFGMGQQEKRLLVEPEGVGDP